MKEPFIITEKDLQDMARRIVGTLADTSSSKAKAKVKVLFLEGDLGAGKTTFTKELAGVLGVLKEDVHSPTFILKKEYKTTHPRFKKLIHIDAYRFDDPQEAKVLRLEKDLEEEGSLVVIEWPSKLGGVIDEDMTITFSVMDDDTREVVVNYVNS
jgi:tRNA threonylcarbamoyladenosine biosynthesis protein TsaE